MSTRVGIIGSGVVGQTIANGFIKHGYDVMIGTNNATKHAELKTKTGNKAQVGSFAETARFGEIIVLAVKGTAAEATVRSIYTDLNGKLVIDTTNPITDAPPVNGVMSYFTGPNESLMERLQKIAPGAHIVKSFSSVGSAFMVNPDFGGEKPTMFICGNNDAARSRTVEIMKKFGWESEDMGKAESARAIEPLAILWCTPDFIRNDWSHVFKLLKK